MKNLVLFLNLLIFGFFISSCNSDDETITNPNIVNGVDTTIISSAYNFTPNYVDVLASNMHYIDEPGEGDLTFVLVHGQPTSSYLWRNIIPHLKTKGRVIAPDLIGMGKSGKPDIDYTYTDHIEYFNGFINQLNLENIILVVHDWGGPVGFNYANEFPSNVKGVVFFETPIAPVQEGDILPEFQGVIDVAFAGNEGDTTLGSGWRAYAIDNTFIEDVIPNGIVRPITNEEMNFYRSPYPTVESRKPVWQWPRQLPIPGVGPDENVQIFQSYFDNYLSVNDVPKLFLYGNPGFFGNADVAAFMSTILTNFSSTEIGEGNHYLQEDQPHNIGIEINRWVDEVF